MTDGFNDVIELFEKLNINPLYVIGILFLTIVLKSIDTKHRIKHGDVIFPLFVGFSICWIGHKWMWEKWIIDSITHSAVSYYASRIWGARLRGKR